MHRFFLPLISIALSLLLSVFFQLTASAEANHAVTVSPLRQEAEIAPGFVYSGEFQIKNSGSQTMQIEISAETFNVTNQAYDYLFKTDTNEIKWVTFDTQSFMLQPNESKTVTYEVNVPIGTEPGGYYLALFALNHPSSINSTGITPTERVASLLYLTVSGDSTRSGTLLKLQTPLVVFGPSNWSATLQNSGNLHYRSVYASKIDSIFNHQVSYKEDSRLILPNSVRLVEGSFDLPEIIGIYKVTYTVSLGDNPAHEETRWFLYLPILQTVLVILIIAGLAIVLRRKHH